MVNYGKCPIDIEGHLSNSNDIYKYEVKEYQSVLLNDLCRKIFDA